MRILKSLFELGLSVLRAAVRVVGRDRSYTHRRAGDSRGLIVSALKSSVTAKRVRRLQVWVPSTRVLWCYAVILAAARDRPRSPRDAAEPTVSVSAKPCHSPRTKAF
jgi:hypothetical protein